MTVNKFDLWEDRAWRFLILGILPHYLTRNSKDSIHLIGIILTIPWFVITLPVTLVLCIPALLCIMMALKYAN